MINTVQYSISIAATVERFLKRQKIRFVFYKEEAAFKFTIRMKESNLGFIQYHIYVKPECLLVYGFSPFGWESPNVTARMKEFICYVNQGLWYGAFETDEKILAFRTFVDCAGDVFLTDEVLQHAIYFPIGMFDKYQEEIYDIMFSDVPVQEILKRLKKGGGIRMFLAGRDFDPSKNLPEIYSKYL